MDYKLPEGGTGATIGIAVIDLISFSLLDGSGAYYFMKFTSLQIVGIF